MGPIKFNSFVQAANEALQNSVLNGASFQIKGTKNEQQLVGVESRDYTRTLSKKTDKDGNLVEMGGAKGLLARKIEQGLHLDKLKRTGTDKENNNEVRSAFLQSIRDELAARGMKGIKLKNIPKALRDALKLDDFGLKPGDNWDAAVLTGKPLTARRITEISKAMQNIFGSTQSKDVADKDAIAMGILTGRILPSQNASNMKNAAAVSKDVKRLVVALRELDYSISNGLNKAEDNSPVVGIETQFGGQKLTIVQNTRIDGQGVQSKMFMAKLANGVSFEIKGGITGLLERLEQDVSLNVKFYGKRFVEYVKEGLENPAKHLESIKKGLNGKVLVSQQDVDARWMTGSSSRQATFYQNCLKSILGDTAYKSIAFSRLTLASLKAHCEAALQGAYDKPEAVARLRERINGDEKTVQLINSAVSIETLEAMKKADLESIGKPKVVHFAPPQPPAEEKVPTEAEKKLAEKAKLMHDFISDLVLRSDTYRHDKELALGPKETILSVLKDHPKAFAVMLKDSSAFDSFDFAIETLDDEQKADYETAKTKLSEAERKLAAAKSDLDAVKGGLEPDEVRLVQLQTAVEDAEAEVEDCQQAKDELEPFSVKRELSSMIEGVRNENPEIALVSDEVIIQLADILVAHTFEPDKVDGLLQKLDTERAQGQATVDATKREIEAIDARESEGDISFLDKIANGAKKGLLSARLLGEEKYVKEREAILDQIRNEGLLETLTAKMGEVADKIGEATTTVMTKVSEVIASNVQEAFDLSDDDMKLIRGEAESGGKVGGADSMDKKELWQRSLKDLGGGGAMSPKTGLGLFMLQSLVQYYGKVGELDQRSMLASLLRNTDEKSSPGEVLGALLKGAGPIMQKMMQGLPTEAMPDDLKVALKDMKDNLAPIPQEFVEAELASMVRDSNGAIKSIRVDESLGAASVGQAFFCTMTLADGSEERCVVKLLRPDVQNRAQRERAFFEGIAKDIPGMDKTFAGDLATIMDELDLTIEARNIEAGQVYHQNPNLNIKSVQLHPLVKPTSTSMVMKLAPGKTLSKMTTQVAKDVAKVVKNAETQDIFGNTTHALSIDKWIAMRENLLACSRQMKSCNELIVQMSGLWTEDAVFKGGFYHGDMHSGNVNVAEVTDPATGEKRYELTVLDFGNATQLSQNEQACVIKLLLSSMAHKTDSFVEGFKGLLSPQGLKDFKAIEKELTPQIDAILKMGVSTDTAERMMAVIMMVQKRGIEIPPTIYKFVKSVIRLMNSVAETQGVLRDIRSAISSIGVKDGVEGWGELKFRSLNAVQQLGGAIQGTGTLTGGEKGNLNTIRNQFNRNLDKGGNFDARMTELIDGGNSVDKATFSVVVQLSDTGAPLEHQELSFDDMIGEFSESFVDDTQEGKVYADTVKRQIDVYRGEYRKAVQAAVEKGLIKEGEDLRHAYFGKLRDVKKLGIDKWSTIKDYQTAFNLTREQAETRFNSEFQAAKDAADILKEALKPASESAHAVAETIRERQMAIAGGYLERMEKICDDEYTEGEDFAHAFGVVAGQHSADAINTLGWIQGAKIAKATGEAVDEESERQNVMDSSIDHFLNPHGGMIEAGLLTDESFITESLSNCLKGMVADYAFPPGLPDALKNPNWQDRETRQLLLKTLFHNLTEEKARLEALGMGDKLNEIVQTAHDDPIENDPYSGKMSFINSAMHLMISRVAVEEEEERLSALQQRKDKGEDVDALIALAGQNLEKKKAEVAAAEAKITPETKKYLDDMLASEHSARAAHSKMNLDFGDLSTLQGKCRNNLAMRMILTGSVVMALDGLVFNSGDKDKLATQPEQVKLPNLLSALQKITKDDFDLFLPDIDRMAGKDKVVAQLMKDTLVFALRGRGKMNPFDPKIQNIFN